MFENKLKTKLVSVSDPQAKSLFFKKAFLIALNLGLSVAVAGLILRLTNPANSYTRLDQILMLATASVWLCVYLISGLVFSFGAVFGLSLVGFGLVFAPFFRFVDLTVFGILLGLSLVFAWLSRQAGKKVINNSLKLSPIQIIAVSRGGLIFVLSLLISLSLWSVRFGSLSAPDKIDFIGLFGGFYPSFGEEKTVDELTEGLTEKQLSKILETMLPSGLPGPQAEIIKQGVKQETKTGILKEISSLVGREISPQETISQAIESSFNFYYQNLPESTRRIIDFVILAALFAFWFGIFQLFSFVLYAVFWLILEVLLLLKVIKVSIITVEKEVLTI
ncbi:MAG: hypothetical protein AB1721_00645 [Patescibacteria group bacterium]